MWAETGDCICFVLVVSGHDMLEPFLIATRMTGVSRQAVGCQLVKTIGKSLIGSV